jgi:hypothetical protein
MKNRCEFASSRHPTYSQESPPRSHEWQEIVMNQDAAAAATESAASDPLAAVADAMQSAAASVTQGAAAARQAAEQALPSAGLFANRFLYTTCYAVSYGVVFPLALVALSVPQNNPLVHGMIDGSRAARNKVDEILGGTGASGAEGEVTA